MVAEQDRVPTFDELTSRFRARSKTKVAPTLGSSRSRQTTVVSGSGGGPAGAGPGPSALAAQDNASNTAARIVANFTPSFPSRRPGFNPTTICGYG
jgi:hypothetical protein